MHCTFMLDTYSHVPCTHCRVIQRSSTLETYNYYLPTFNPDNSDRLSAASRLAGRFAGLIR